MSDSVAFDHAADFYDETRGFPPEQESRVASLIADAARLTPASRVLEVGVGTGRIALPLATLVQSITGLDLARPMLNRLVAKRRGQDVRPVEGDALHLPFVAGEFDAVVTVHIFHLIPDWRAVLREMARVLRPGGVLVNAWNEGHHFEDQMPEITRVWREATGLVRSDNVGVSRRAYRTFLPDAGWRLAGEPTSLTYSRITTPRNYLSQLERRVWSSMWRLAEEDVARGLAAVHELVQTQGIDLDAPLHLEARFTAEAFYPPAG